ncbi:MAG TPA: ABC transporter ATP-binding protein [Myxococcales bacterium]|nr:ABC transporter ATP-binding protein [Myxococcales bacterium]
MRLTASYLRSLPRVFQLVKESSRTFAVGIVLLLLGQSLLPASMAWVGKLIVDAVVEAARTGAAEERRLVVELVVIEFALMVVSTVLSRCQSLLRDLMRASLGNHVNVLILEKAATLDLRHFEDADTYDKMQNARREASIRPLSLVLQLASLVQQLLILATYAALLARLSWWSTLVIVAASLPAFVAEARFSGESFRLNSWRAPEGRRQNYLEWIITRDSHVKEVKLFGLAPLILSRYRAYFEKFYSEDRKLALRKTWAGLILGALSLLAFYASYLYMADRAARARITLGDLTLYLAAFRQGQQAIQSALASIGGLYEDGLFVSNLFAFLDLESTGERPRGKPRALPAARSQTVEFEDVSFQYPGGDRPALTGVTLRIEPGEKLALVGDNGAGKSTLIKLLLRLYEPTGGRILYGGIDLRDIDPRSLRDRIGILFQDFVRYQFTAQENVGLGQVQAIGERPRIETAIDRAGARGVIEELPRKLDTMLGGWFEEGHELSGGQWQKIALARAFMREDAELLVLDEPTASLDAEAEHDLFQRLKALAKDRSAILISHRFSTVRTADRIAVLQGGRISELGSHEELIARNGRYAHLFRLQASGYVDGSASAKS